MCVGAWSWQPQQQAIWGDVETIVARPLLCYGRTDKSKLNDQRFDLYIKGL